MDQCKGLNSHTKRVGEEGGKTGEKKRPNTKKKREIKSGHIQGTIQLLHKKRKGRNKKGEELKQRKPTK